MEVDETANANLISYEEYYPFGSSAYRTHNNDAEAAASRYRYTGKERDEESGLYYHGARYFAPWLARWTSADPKAEKAGLNFYQYVSSNPIRMNDPDGKDGNDTVTPRRGTTTTPREEPQPPVAPLVPRSTFDLPSLLDTRTPLQRRADSFAGTLAPTLRLPIPTAAPSPSDPAPTRTTTGVTTDFSLIPPHIMVAYRDRFIFDADTTRAVIAVRTHSDWTVQSGYQYGQDISLSYGNPLWNFRVGFKPTGDTPRGTIEINGRDSLSSPTTFLRITTDSGDAADGVMLGQIVPRAFTVGGQDFPFAWNLHVNPYRPGVGLSFGLGGPLLATPEVLRDHTNLAYGAGVRVAEDAYDLFRQHGPLPIPGIGDFISRHADPQDGRATSDFDHIGNAATDFSNIGGVRRGFDVRAGFGVSAERLPDARVDFRVNFQLQFYHF
jgi:RHS repeat-associated protein